MEISEPKYRSAPDDRVVRLLLSTACEEVALANGLYAHAEAIRAQLKEPAGAETLGRLRADACGAIHDAVGRELQIAQELRAALEPSSPAGAQP